MQRLHVDRRRRRRAASGTKHIGGSALKLRLPRCPITLDGGKRHLRLERRGVEQFDVSVPKIGELMV